MAMPEAAKVLVTGGSGFVGSHVVDELLEAGHSVRCLVRGTSRLRWLEGKPIETIEADLSHADLAPAVDGVDAVIHCAGLTRGSPESLRTANVEATRRLLEACAVAPARPSFVFCSSLAAVGPATRQRPRRTDDLPEPNSEYGRSKLAAETEVRARAAELPAVVLRPAAVYGPRDADTLPFFRMAAKGLVVIPGPGRRLVQLVHARDVASALLLGMKRADGECRTYYVAHPQAFGWDELARAIGGALGRRTIVVPLPAPVFRMAGALAELTGASRRAGALDRRRARDLVEAAWTCDVGPTMAEMGWRPRFDLESGLGDTVRWYREAGWL